MKLHEAVIATYGAVGQEMSDGAIALIVRELEPYPAGDVAVALSRVRKELRKITLVDILDRIPGGHLGPEEAWAIVAPTLNDERVTVVWTEQISQAFGAALGLQDDAVAARMAFKEVYGKLLGEARSNNVQPRWFPSLGHDPHGRDTAILNAVEKGRLTAESAQRLLSGHGEADQRLERLLSDQSIKRIE